LLGIFKTLHCIPSIVRYFQNFTLHTQYC